MDTKRDLIFYQHIYKCGGTSIRNGYMHCARHKMLHQQGPRVSILDSDLNESKFRTNELDDLQCVFFTGSVSSWRIRDLIDTNRMQAHYIVTLRNPIDRLMSAYNYYNKWVKNNLESRSIDFELWFLNKRVIEPIQWDFQHIDILTKFMAMEHANPAMLKYQPLDHDKYYSQAMKQIEIWKPTVLILENNHQQGVQKVLDQYYPGEFEFDNQHSKDNASVNGLQFETLNDSMQNRILEELDTEIKFYNQWLN